MRRFAHALLWLLAGTVSIAHAETPSEQVQLSLERYQQLMAKARRLTDGQVSWSRGTVQVRVASDNRSVEVTVSAQLRAISQGPTEAALLPADVTLKTAQIDGSPATLVRAAGTHVALIEAGTHQVQLTYLVNAGVGDDSAPYAMIPIPPIPGADLSVNGAGDLRAWPSVAAKITGNQLTAQIPATSAVMVRWGRSAGGDIVRRIDWVLTPDIQGQGVDVAATYEIRSTGRRTAARLVKADAALVDVREGDTPIATRVTNGWHTAIIEGRGRHTLKVRFRLAIDRSHGQPQVTLNPNQVAMVRVAISVPGTRDVNFEPAVPTTTDVKGEGEAATTRAVAHLPPLDQVTLSWTEARAAPETEVRFNTETYQLLTLKEGVLKTRAIVRFDVINGKLRELPLALAEGVIPSKVSGPGIEDWRVYPADGDAPRQVRIMLGQELEGSLEIEVQYDTVINTEEGTTINPLPLIAPVKPFYQMGVVALFDGDRVGFAPVEAAGFNKAGQDALPPEIRQKLQDNVSQAFRHVGAPGIMSSAVTTARTREVRFDAHINTLYEIREGSLTGHASVLIEIKSGRRDRLHISLPDIITAEPRVSGPSLKKVIPAPDFDAGKGRKAYEVQFTQALQGAFELDIGFEYTPAKGLGQMKLPGLEIHGAELTAGHIGIAAETGMEVKPSAPTDLRKVPVEELPKAIRLRTDLELEVGYQFARAPWVLDLDVKRHETVETLTAVATHVWIETNVLENGHIVTHASYAVTNDEASYLRLSLPKGASVLSVYAAQKKVKAVADEFGAVAIPLPKNTQVRVDVAYETMRDKLGTIASVELIAPKADLRQSDIRWLVRTPWRFTSLSTSTDLTIVEPYQYGGMADGGADIELPTDDMMRSFAFTYSVYSEGDPLKVEMRLIGAQGGDWMLLLLSFLALLVVTLHRGRGRPMTIVMWALLALGIVALLIKSALWSLESGEIILMAFVLTVLGVMTVLSTRKKHAAENSDA